VNALTISVNGIDKLGYNEGGFRLILRFEIRTVDCVVILRAPELSENEGTSYELDLRATLSDYSR
jgi:hypothetical protein